MALSAGLLSSRVSELARSHGADFVGIADLSIARSQISDQGGEWIATFPNCISVGMHLLSSIVDQLPRREEAAVRIAYRHHAFEVINPRLDLIAMRLAAHLENRGYGAYPVPASKRIDDVRQCGQFSHKLAAHLAGLGWIGKSCLLVTPRRGPRVRLATVLTDAPLEPTGDIADEGCGDCTECIDICPVKAFTGRPFQAGEPREARYDAGKCHRYHKSLEEKHGSGVCGLCVQVCPIGRARHDGTQDGGSSAWSE